MPTTNPVCKEYESMKQQLEMMEFGVTGLAEVRTLVKRGRR